MSDLNCTLLVICPVEQDATSLYRGIGPMGALRQKNRGLRLSLVNMINWATLKMVDAVFMQRPFRPSDVQIAELCALNGVPLWVDYDDDLLGVTDDNPTHQGTYGKSRAKDSVQEIISMANVVTCSTDHLTNKFEMVARQRGGQGKFITVNNAFDNSNKSYLRTRPAAVPKDRSPVIAWRGSDTHVKDVMIYADQIAAVVAKFPEWEWHFFGWNPWVLKSVIPANKFVHHDYMDPIKYQHHLRMVSPDIVWVPLWPSEFNLAKSNIAMIEGAYAGAAIVAPRWPEWMHQGVATYDPRVRGSLGETIIETMAKSQAERDVMSAETWASINDGLLLTQQNQTRRRILRELIQ